MPTPWLVPERPDRRRRPGRDGVRQLGRRAGRWCVQQFSLEYTRRVLAQLKRTGVDGQDVPRIVFTKGGGIWLDDMNTLDCEVLGLDWTANLGKARAIVGGQVGGPGKALQGNIDPNVLFAPPAQIASQVHAVLDSFGKPHRPHDDRPDASSAWATASASSPRPSMWRHWSRPCTATRAQRSALSPHGATYAHEWPCRAAPFPGRRRAKWQPIHGIPVSA